MYHATMQKRLHALLFMTMSIYVASGCGTTQTLAIVSDGRPRAVIVVAEDARPITRTAARHFQEVIEQMTGVKLPIQTEGDYEGDDPIILVGMSKLVRSRGIDVPQDPEAGDQYIIRSGKGWIALVGNDGGMASAHGSFRGNEGSRLCGSAYAVYDLLQRLGCGWYGPDPLWHVIPQSGEVEVPSLDITERADFAMRHIWMVDPHPVLRFAWRLGAHWIPVYHALEYIVPASQFKQAHPEWFGPGQPCLTEPAIQQTIVEKFRTEIDAGEGVFSFSICPNDNNKFCECERCRATGNISARMMLFANEIARRLSETHPGRFRLCFLAYWVTHEPPAPMVKAEPGVVVAMVNEGNHVRPLGEPVPPEHAKLDRNNLREQRDMSGWMETGALKGVYEWWIPGCGNHDHHSKFSPVEWRSVPWYSGETALRNLRYWKANGIRYLTYETDYESGNGFPIRWPLYYIGARGAWNASVTAEEVMTEACDKLYGSAAEDMLGFYRILEKAMADCMESGWNWTLPSPDKVYGPEVEEKAGACLERAAGATTDAKALARIAEEQRMWNEARKALAKCRRNYFRTIEDSLFPRW